MAGESCNSCAHTNQHVTLGAMMIISSGILQSKSASVSGGIHTHYAFWVLDGVRVDGVLVDDYLDSLAEIGKHLTICQSVNGMITAIETPTGEKIGAPYLEKVFRAKGAQVFMFYLLVSLLMLPFFGLGLLVFPALYHLYPGRQRSAAIKSRSAFLSR